MSVQILIAAEFTSVIYLLVQFISTLLKRGEKSKSSKILNWVIFSLIVSCLSEAIPLLLLDKHLSDFILSVFLFFSYSGGAITLLLFVYYCYCYISEKTSINKWLFYVPILLIVLDFIYIIIITATGNLFKVKNGIVLVAESLPYSSLILIVSIMLYLPILAFSKHKQIGKRSVLILGFFGIIPIITTVFSFATNTIDFSFPASAVACSLVNILLENKSSYEKINHLDNQLQDSKEEISNRIDIIKSMTSVYFASFYIDLTNDTYVELSSKDNIRDVVKTVGKAQASLFLACEKLMAPEFTDEMKEFFDLSTIQERLKNKKVISRRYVGVTSGWSMAYLIAGDRDKNGNLLHIFYACRTIHDEKAREEAQKEKLEEYNEIIANAGLGIWYIFLKDGAEPRMQPNKKMYELLGISEIQKLSEEEIYSWWHERILPEAIPSVERSVAEMMNNQFSENTYLWNHPEKGAIYVRCGGTSKILEDGTCVLSGYHSDVTHIVMQEALVNQAKELEENQRRITQTNLSLLSALGTVVEFRSLESGEHVQRVMNFTRIILEKVKENFPEYKLTSDQIVLMSRAAALHDVGKIAIPDDILKAPRKLSETEFEEMKQHTIYGCEILERFNFIEHNEFYKYCYDICRWHHEKADGNGYPDNLGESDIPIYCQATAIADCFDALVSKRVYKDALVCQDAYDMIVNGECGVFSKNILKCFELAKDELFETVESV